MIESFIAFLNQEFLNEILLFSSFSPLEKGFYIFYALAAILAIRPHIQQAMKYRNGEAGKGDFYHRAHYEAMFWRLAPLCYAFTINSKLLFISVLVDLLGRLWTNYEAHKAEHRFMAAWTAYEAHKSNLRVGTMDPQKAKEPQEHGLSKAANAAQ